MKNNDNSISIVTAFFDIGRGELTEDKGYPSYLKRTADTYFSYFENLATLNNEMIIFTSEEYKNRVLAIREGKPTKVITLDIFSQFSSKLEEITKVQNSIEFKNKVNPELLKNIEYWSPQYILVTNLKPFFVNYAIKNNLTSSKYISWIDFGYIRNKETLNQIIEWKHYFKEDRISLFSIKKLFKLNNIKDVYNAIFNNKVFIIGGAIVSTKSKWIEFYEYFEKNREELLVNNIIDDDQGIILMCLFRNNLLFDINYLGREQWFSLFKRYDQTSKIGLLERIKDFLGK